jgi:hypothetical protein
MMGAIATGPWDAQPDDLHRLEIPLDLKDSNLVGALGPRGANLYDLVDTNMLSVVKGLGDSGGIVRLRDRGACSTSSDSFEWTSSSPYQATALMQGRQMASERRP